MKSFTYFQMKIRFEGALMRHKYNGPTLSKRYEKQRQLFPIKVTRSMNKNQLSIIQAVSLLCTKSSQYCMLLEAGVYHF